MAALLDEKRILNNKSVFRFASEGLYATGREVVFFKAPYRRWYPLTR